MFILLALTIYALAFAESSERAKLANKLHAQLKSEDKEVRWKTIEELKEEFSFDKHDCFIELWLTALGDDDWRIRYEAVNILKQNINKYEGSGRNRRAVISIAIRSEVIDGLIKTLEDNNADIRSKAVIALGKAEETEVIAPLLKTLNDEHPRVQQAAIAVFRHKRNGRSVFPLLGLLEHTNERVRTRAEHTLKTLIIQVNTVEFGAHEMKPSNEWCLYNPDVSQLTFNMPNLRRVVVNSESCDLQMLESFAKYVQTFFESVYLKKYINVFIQGNPGGLSAKFWTMCLLCKYVDVPTDIIVFGKNQATQKYNLQIAVNPDLQHVTIPMTDLQKVIVDPETCRPQQLEGFVQYTQQCLGEKYLKKHVSININGNPINLPSAFQNLCQTCRRLDVSIKNIVFGTNGAPAQNSSTTLHNPDLSNLLLPLPRLRQVTIYTGSYDFHQVERFLTYALNYLEPSHLSKELQVTIRGRKDDLHPNLLNNFLNTCQHVEVID